MVYSSELLVVMTDRLKTVRIRARNVPRVTFLRLSLKLKRVVWRARGAAAPSCWNKNSSPDNPCMSGSGL